MRSGPDEPTKRREKNPASIVIERGTDSIRAQAASPERVRRGFTRWIAAAFGWIPLLLPLILQGLLVLTTAGMLLILASIAPSLMTLRNNQPDPNAPAKTESLPIPLSGNQTKTESPLIPPSGNQTKTESPLIPPSDNQVNFSHSKVAVELPEVFLDAFRKIAEESQRRPLTTQTVQTTPGVPNATQPPNQGPAPNTNASGQVSAASIKDSVDNLNMKANDSLTQVATTLKDVETRLVQVEQFLTKGGPKNPATVLVAVCDCTALSLTDVRPAFESLLESLPGRLAGLRLGLYVFTGANRTDVLAVNAAKEPGKTSDLKETSDLKDLNAAKLKLAAIKNPPAGTVAKSTEVLAQIVTLFPIRAAQEVKRCVIVLPADSDIPVRHIADVQPGSITVDVLLVDHDPKKSSRVNLDGWSDFCSRRGGLLRVLRRHINPPIVHAATGNEPPIDKELVKQLGKELLRLTYPEQDPEGAK